MTVDGSSPLTRGKLRPAGRRPRRAGLIPAHAGKTSPPKSSSTASAAHPRSRGENRAWRTSTSKVRGSSPLTRGKPRLVKPTLPHPRLIPAHAGKTTSSVGGVSVIRAHPRSRGENILRSRKPEAKAGSSPLTRGKPVWAERAKCMSGLIPAHAGKTESLCFRSLSLSAHPRSRGENSFRSVSDISPYGSSPLTRGKPRSAPPRPHQARLIPAHAGKTLAGFAGVGRGAAHPRSRGENNDPASAPLSLGGSSPLTRGKQRVSAHTRPVSGLIPAHAGKTYRPRSS